MEISEALEWAAGHRVATLVTLRRDGRAQRSTVADGRCVIRLEPRSVAGMING